MIYIPIVILVSGINGVLAYGFYKSTLSPKDCVKLPNFYFYFGVVFSLLFMLPIVGLVAGEKFFYKEPLFWLFLCVVVLLILMAITQVNWRLYIGDESFVHRNIFGVRREYRYDEVKYIKPLKRLGDTIIKIDGKLLPIVIDKYAFGLEEFIRKYNRYKLSKSPK